MATISARKQKDYSEKIALIPGIMQTVSEHEKRITKQDHTLYGNDKIGHDEQLRNIWAWIDLQKQKEQRRLEWWNKFQWVVIPIAVSGFSLFLGQAVYFWLAIVPDLMKIK